MGKSKTRTKTGNWRPFRPAGMSDGAWKTILLLHRYPTDEMDEEERKHCLGPMLFGKGGPRFGDYGRGWIQERADELVREGLTPYAMDARAWHDEIVNAIDFYNGETFAEAQANGDAKAEADFFITNIPWTGGSGTNNGDVNRYFEARELAESRIDDIWHRITYGPFGAGPWHVLTKGVLNGWQNAFVCEEGEAFKNVTRFDWRCAAVGQSKEGMDLRFMTETCPICPNAAILGGIDRALAMAYRGNLETGVQKKLCRYLKRAFGELYKRRDGILKTAVDDAYLSDFYNWLFEREIRVTRRFVGESVLPGGDSARGGCPSYDFCCRANDCECRKVSDELAALRAEIDRLAAKSKNGKAIRNKKKEEKQ